MSSTVSGLQGAECSTCPLAVEGQAANPVFPETRRPPKLAIVGLYPSYAEVDSGRPLSGPFGRIFDAQLDQIQIQREDLHVNNLLLCRPQRETTTDELNTAFACCSQRLHRELHALPTRHVLTLGARPMSVLSRLKTGLQLAAGAPVKGSEEYSGFTVVPTLLAQRIPAQIPIMRVHLARAYGLAVGAIKPWRWPKFHTEVGAPMIAALKKLRAAPWLSVDIENFGPPMHATLMCIGVSDGKTTVSVPWDTYLTKHGIVNGIESYGAMGQEVADLLVGLLSTKPLVGQNLTHDFLGLKYRAGIPVRLEQFHFDTMLAHRLIAPRLRHNLQHITLLEFHCSPWKTDFGSGTNEKGLAKFRDRPELVLRDYNAKDAYMTARLVKPLTYRLRHQVNAWEGLWQNTLECEKIAIRMTERGFAVDPSRFGGHARRFKANRSRVRRVFRLIAQKHGFETFNLKSNLQLRKLFYKTWRCPVMKRSEKTGLPSLNAEALQFLAVHIDEDISLAARALGAYRRWDKLLDYVTEAPIENVHHVSWNVSGARTGRWSSSPNLQNIPKGKVVYSGGRKQRSVSLRDIFVARPRHYLVAADYSALEMRIVALLAGAKKLIDAFAQNVDVHALNAQGLFPKWDSMTAKQRKQARDLTKRFSYAVLYGAAAPTLHKKLSVDFPALNVQTVQFLIDAWFDLHPELFRWQTRSFELARQNLYVEVPISGRRQKYASIEDVDYNEVLNFPCQGLAAHIMDTATRKVANTIDWQRDFIVAQVHDELVTETTNKKRMTKTLVENMTTKLSYNGYDMEFPVEVKIGRDWGTMKGANR